MDATREWRFEEQQDHVNNMSKQIYQQNKDVGWWDDPNRCIVEVIQLINSEISEATEGERKGIMDDHLPHRKMGEVELADALIRTLDLGGHMGWEYNAGDVMEIVQPMNFGMFKSIIARHGLLTLMVSGLIGYFIESDDEVAEQMANYMPSLYSGIIFALCNVSRDQGYDIETAMMEKLEYNKHRSDHKRENRAKPGGKKH